MRSPEICSYRDEGHCRRPAAVFRLLPGLIVTFQLVAKAHSLRNNEAQRRIVKFQIARQRRETKILSWRVALSVGDHPFHVHRRRNGISREMSRIDHL